MDNRQGVLLILLDLSTAFSTLDHDILLSRLESRIGISGSALGWVSSYLSDCYQSVHISGQSSDPSHLKFGVPHDSVQGPVVFTIYTSPVADIIRRHGLEYHLYADDTQVYIAFSLTTPGFVHGAIDRVMQCVCELQGWMVTNKLKLNEEKTTLFYCAATAKDSSACLIHRDGQCNHRLL